ncbi:lysosomal-associated transmembrane protein 5 [Xenopus tropicalis]|uniref:Lysosomal-associated transmembrane protein 5 n=1 Tax=Xenopus tropicalis TaxID=8364 RepID=A0A8J0QGF4_XENTR|nr:lysosomal-associated transmembrane protein 5 [Xenopus tropicalis]|eukprot:NP_001182638.1 lysosomal-associated transmembrane protein 5 [Xenopus tropicalis]
MTPNSKMPSCFNSRTVAHTLSLYHLVMSIFLLVEKTLDVNKKSDRYNSTAEVLSSYILLAILFVISLLLSCGILMKRGPLVIPFLALQFLDLISSSLMFCSVYIEQPSFQASEGVKMKDKMSERLLQAPAQMAFDICLNLLIQCSSFSVFPSYLKLEYINPMNDFPKKNMSSKKYVLDLVLFNIMYISVLILKAIFISHIWRVFVSLHHKKSSKDEDAQKQQEISKGVLPSYEEAVRSQAIKFPVLKSATEPNKQSVSDTGPTLC